MQDDSGKPRLLYYDVDISALKSCERIQSESEQRAYTPFFDCTRIFAGNRDFISDVKQYRPDLVIFVGFVERQIPVAAIANTDAFPEIPRIGLHTTDIFCPLWWANHQCFAALGVHACFSNHFVPGVDWDREMRIPCYYLPRMVSDEIFHDYGEEKLFHAGLFGHGFWRPHKLYPWRNAVVQAICEKMVIVTTGRVEVVVEDDPLLPYGENYARLINRCLFSLSCSTSIQRPVEKCLQIPAAMSCLVTNENALMREYGFRDLENCVVVDQANALEKMQMLLNDRKELQAITERGYRLVQENYTGAQPRTFLNWLHAFRRLRPGENIVQTGVMEFACAELGTTPSRVLAADPNPGQALLPQAVKLLLEDDLDNAEQIFNAMNADDGCGTALDIGRAFLLLRRREPEAAYKRLRPNLLWLEAMGRGKPGLRHDPALFACLIILTLTEDNIEALPNVLQRAEGLQHPLLQAARIMAGLRTGEIRDPISPEALDNFVFNGANCQSECPISFPNARGYFEFLRKILEAFDKKGLLLRIDRVLP